MKVFFKCITVGIALSLISCGNSAETPNETVDTGSEEVAAAKPAAGKIDPICEMEKDSSWTEYSVYKQDTIWFCSEGCKKAFEARPDKYIKG